VSELPALDEQRLPAGTNAGLAPKPRFLLLYGSGRPNSFTHLLVKEAALLLERLGGEARIFEPQGLPLPESAPADHPKVVELREMLAWADAHLWCSPEYFGTLSAVMKAQLDWMLPVIGGVKVTQDKPLAVAQVCGAGVSHNTSLTLATVGRWLGLVTIPAQLCVAKVQEEFDTNGRMKPSPYYDALVDMAEELFKTTLALRDRREQLLDRYSSRGGAAGH